MLTCPLSCPPPLIGLLVLALRVHWALANEVSCIATANSVAALTERMGVPGAPLPFTELCDKQSGATGCEQSDPVHTTQPG